MAAGRDLESTWYKDAILYELHVRAFKDSNADGVGDFAGLIHKLDYLQDLGVTALWLLPFYPSPLKDDGYDISDYTGVNKAYGSLRDIRRLVKEAHARGLRVITELVCNHTSDEHPWFQRARRARPGSPWRDFYVWSETNQKYEGARIIFKDFEVSNWTWDHVAGAYYWHRFYSHQPDLNYDNPRVRKAIMNVLDFWLDMGIDGLRLDAVPYLFEREGTTCENLPETHEFLKELRRHVDSAFPNRMLLAEANQWPEDAVTYFGQGDESHMCFHFPLMPRLFMAVRMEDRFPIIDILAQTPSIPEQAQWALFLRNHDELTLEMVTDEERDYMYRVYSQDPEARINLGIRRRLGPLMGSNRRRVELMNGLLFSLPGTPVIYYGDEIGMGDNIYLGDRNGVRTPMQWSADRNAGFSTANRQRLFLPVIVDPEYHYESVNVEAQQGNQQSLLGWMKRLIGLRKQFEAFGRGSFEVLHPHNRKVLAFIRRFEHERILVVANLSRFAQAVELDMRDFDGLVPTEMFGRTEFPPIGQWPYLLTLAPHGFYWFSLEPQHVEAGALPSVGSDLDIPEIVATGSWEELVREPDRQRLNEVLPSYLQVRRWFAGKARRVKSARIVDNVPIPHSGGVAQLLTVEVMYADGDPELYALPVAHLAGENAHRVLERSRDSVLARVEVLGEPGVIYDALAEPSFAQALLDVIGRRGRFRGSGGTLVGTPTTAFSRLRGAAETELEAALASNEQSNNSVIFGERLILKLFRRLEEGPNPELELGRFFTEQTSFTQVAPLAGGIEYRGRREATTLAVLLSYVPNQGDAWKHALTVLEGYFERVQRRHLDGHRPPVLPGSLSSLIVEDLSSAVRSEIGEYLEWAELLGRRTAEMHLALASATGDPRFAPEPSTMLEQRSAYQSIRALALNVFETLRRQARNLEPAARPDAEIVLELEGEVIARVRTVLERPVTARRIRCHGDYHLGQLLFTGHDFVIVDFEGEPARPLLERRRKRWAARDVAGMLRSFDYAAQSALINRVSDPRRSGPEQGHLQVAATLWTRAVSSVYLKAYLETATRSPLVSRTLEETAILLETMLIEKALYELRYELNNRPSWVGIPLRGVLSLLASDR